MRIAGLIITGALTFSTILPAFSDVWYVDVDNASGVEDGLSWDTAFSTLQPAIDAAFGQVQTLRQIRDRNPDAPVWFWRMWYFGFIPWDRQTVTPASLFESPLLETVAVSEDLVERLGGWAAPGGTTSTRAPTRP